APAGHLVESGPCVLRNLINGWIGLGNDRGPGKDASPRGRVNQAHLDRARGYATVGPLQTRGGQPDREYRVRVRIEKGDRVRSGRSSSEGSGCSRRGQA